MRNKWYFFALLATLCISMAFKPAKDYKFHTVFVYNFVKYVQWPENPNDKIIAIYSTQPDLIQEFVKMSRYKNTADRKMIIKSFSSVEDIPEAHAIFVPSEKANDLTLIKNKLDGKPVLLISEGNGNLKYGSSVNLIMHGGRLNFEVSQTNLNKSKLKMSSKLMNLAVTVN